jgi:hypothetical protein
MLKPTTRLSIFANASRSTLTLIGSRKPVFAIPPGPRTGPRTARFCVGSYGPRGTSLQLSGSRHSGQYIEAVMGPRTCPRGVVSNTSGRGF